MGNKNNEFYNSFPAKKQGFFKKMSINFNRASYSRFIRSPNRRNQPAARRCQGHENFGGVRLRFRASQTFKPGLCILACKAATFADFTGKAA
jgi:hypothetical protein